MTANSMGQRQKMESRMQPRERVLLAINQREPDRVPFDLGGTGVTGIHVEAYRRLRSFLGLPGTEPVVLDSIQNLALIEDDVRDSLGVDAGRVQASSPLVGQARTCDDDDYSYLFDEYGLGWRMPKDGGLYRDLFLSPLSGDITIEDVDGYPLPDPLDPGRLAGLREACLRVRDQEGRAVVVWGFGDGVFEVSGYLRGLENFYMDLAANPNLACRLMDRLLERKIAYVDAMLEEIGDVVDVVCEGDDLGGQFATLISPEMYRSLVKPRHRELFQSIHRRTEAKLFLHCCGSIRPLIPDLIEVGVDILNPVQVSAAHMDSAELKREFGRELVFWGGGVDTQHVLGNETPSRVREEVKRRLGDFMPGGGYVFSAVHNIQANVPPENIMAMWETVQEFGVY